MSCSFGSVDARAKTSNNYKNKKETKTLMKTITTIKTKSITTKQTTKTTTTTTSMPNVLRMSCGFGSEDASAPKTPKRDFQGLWARFEIVTITISNGDSPSTSIKTEHKDLIKSVNISRDGDKFNCRGCNGGYVSQR